MKSNLDYLLLSEAIEDGKPPTFVLSAMTIVCFALLAFLIWSVFFKLEEISSSQGIVIPTGNIYKVQHLEGGIIKNIFIREGEMVDKGQRLIEFHSEPATSNLQKAKHRALYIYIHLNRLNAFIEEEELTVDGMLSGVYLDNYDIETAREIAEDAAMILQHYIKNKNNSREILNIKHDRLTEDLKNMRSQYKTSIDNFALLEKELSMYDNLEEGSYARVKIFEVQRDVNKSRALLLETERVIQNTVGMLSETSEELLALESSYMKATLEEIDDLSAELLEVKGTIKKLEDSVSRLIIYSEISGIVKGLAVDENNVINPGGNLLEIVPLDEELIVEARISTSDVGHVSIGDVVNVKITAFDFSLYGSIDGVVSSISASTFSDDQGKPYYKANIKLSKNYLGENEGENIILPGMIASADIITGKKSIMKYLLKPIFKRAGEAFKER